MEQKIKYGLIHCHTYHSLKDSTLKPSVLVKKAKSYGAPAVVLSDHGTLTGVYEFMHAAKEQDIKGIPGVEAYMFEDDDVAAVRKHLLLIPKNYIGFRAISDAVTMSSDRIYSGHPCMNMAILRACFGQGTKGHDNVIATSACVGGVLSMILLHDTSLQAEIDKAKSKKAKYNDPNDPAYITNKRQYDDINDRIRSLTAEKNNCKKIASGSSIRFRKALSVMDPSSSEYAQQQAKINDEDDRISAAAIREKELTEQICKMRSLLKQIKAQLSAAEKTHASWTKYNDRIIELSSHIKGQKALYNEAVSEAEQYDDIFGHGNFYCELQYHGIDNEKIVMPLLAEIADHCGLPLVACNDIHYADGSDEDIRARKIINWLRFCNAWKDDRPGDNEYYVKSDEELKNMLLQILPPETAERAMHGIKTIIDACNVEFPSESHYPKFKSDNGETAKERLERLAAEGIRTRYPGKAWNDEYQQRMQYELSVIEKLGFSDYLCIVQDFLAYGRSLGTDNPEKVGLSIGPGRGSAAGSLVCYLIGITDIDPMKYGLIFERFLNTERVSMPDIDSDFAIDIRDKVLDYVKNKYGYDAVCNIMTQGTLAAKSAIKNATRANGAEKYADDGALRSLGNEIAAVIPKTPGIHIADVDKELKARFGTNDEAMQIIKDAKSIEGVPVQYGMHAAGVIIADNHKVSDYIPLMAATDNYGAKMCQCNMVEAEADAGLLKMDFLGLMNLNIISDALRDIKRNTGTSINMIEVGKTLNGHSTAYDRVKANVFTDIFSCARTNGVFQFESSGMKQMLKQFKPDCLEDLILLVAAYRPGPMQYLSNIIQVKKGEVQPHYIVPEMQDILSSTYGYPVYQEQIMQIFNKIAGFSLGTSDIIRRYMSKKKTAKFAAYKDDFIRGICRAGADRKDAESFWDQLLEFSRYAFNKSHAACYATLSFYTAWLKLNYPVEYMTALLNHTDTKKMPMIITECKHMGINVLPPEINRSDINFTNDSGDILFGFSKVKGIKNSAEMIISERKHEHYHSLKDFEERTQISPSDAKLLAQCGVFDIWSDNREAVASAYDEMITDFKKISAERIKINKRADEFRVQTGSDTIDSHILEQAVQDGRIKKIAVTNYFKALSKYQSDTASYERIVIPVGLYTDKQKVLADEKELMGMYVSGHPLDDYKDLKDQCSGDICDAQAGKVCFGGIIENLRQTARKKDNQPMAFFTLTDKTGSIDVCCFVESYKKNAAAVKEGAVVCISGTCQSDDDNDEDDTFKLIAEQITPVSRSHGKVMISVRNVFAMADGLIDTLHIYDGNDYDVFLYDRQSGLIREPKIPFAVSSEIFKARIPDVFMIDIS